MNDTEIIGTPNNTKWKQQCACDKPNMCQQYKNEAFVENYCVICDKSYKKV
jgi:hypothetical protein